MRLTQEYRKLKEATTKSPPIKIVENTADICSKIHIKVNYSEGKSTSLAGRSYIPREWRHNNNYCRTGKTTVMTIYQIISIFL